MILSLFAKKLSPAVEQLYTDVMQASRRQGFYLDLGVPDSAQGRFEMAILHTWLMLRRSRNHPELQGLAQEFVDLLFRELDSALREMGIGDMAVPRRMKKLAGAAYGRFAAYDEAIVGPDREPLRLALCRNIALTDDGAGLAEYFVRADRDLAQNFAPDAFLSGRIDFPPLASA